MLAAIRLGAKQRLVASSASRLSAPWSASVPSLTRSFSTTAETTAPKKNIFQRVYDEYSIPQQQHRIKFADQLFRFAQVRADAPEWFGPGRFPRDFRPRHALLTMHLWFLHKRLVSETRDNHSALLIQEELFDIFWDDTQKRIRREGVAEMTVNKHVTDVQQYTFQHLTHYDHAFTEFELKPKARFEELCGIVWIHFLQRETENFQSDQVQRMAYYIDAQYNNIVNRLPQEYWEDARLAWVDIPDFSNMKDNKGRLLPEKAPHADDVSPEGWYRALTNSGEAYYWNPTKHVAQYERPY